ncbi:5-formyltetrahydrofolate cyclo-ligase [Pseudoclavibacter endophyticus]|uniref:5-formyltetrahydrofolate cyclo-ligase n=1 Tax=Pseudoclavibacter endophyticus TaxID=1778590 RepID=A0A6H9WEW0_9MICO|nr:5-formyltetrahydrofolate cyclo-ligase [Pseudoclavibacter endophyticus]KAB1649452.1 5-formyltetrahydrofolate cyclo-ligase [Pseudoclavibacter endophyticus]GGA62549.1 5-formyltetrahydrofolate cyclo-ligase [Pseudoclavibacter endophyticus]
MTDNAVARKSAIRAEVRRRRRARPQAERDAADAAIARHGLELASELRAESVALYLSTPTEPGTRGLIAALDNEGIRVLLPRPTLDGGLEWVCSGGGELMTPGLGTPEPIGAALAGDPLGDADLVFTPASAVDRHGGRLGWGGGYYDRALVGIRPVDAVAGGTEPVRAPIVTIVFDDDVLDSVPTEPHDVPIDGVLTPSGLLRFAPG